MSMCRYVSILVELTRMEGTRHGALIAAQMLDVAIRVNAIRHFAVSQMVGHSNELCLFVIDVHDLKVILKQQPWPMSVPTSPTSPILTCRRPKVF